ncbi:hypothetical protein ES703_106933 [subsurface metagenome]
MGDVHANMGEGEICIGIECGAEVTVEIIEVLKDRFIPAPIIEDNEHWYVVSNDPTLKEATYQCSVSFPTSLNNRRNSRCCIWCCFGFTSLAFARDVFLCGNTGI